jgi:hypothetical protein
MCNSSKSKRHPIYLILIVSLFREVQVGHLGNEVLIILQIKVAGYLFSF